MKKIEMDDQSLNGEKQRLINTNSDLLQEENNPVINDSDKVATKKRTLLDDLIEKSDNEIKELVQPLNSEERIKLLNNINKEISDFESVVRLLIHVRSICKENESLEKSNEFEQKIMIEKLKSDLLVNPEWDIYYDGGIYFVKNMFGESFPIDVELRKKFPNSYFHSPECDKEIVGYNSITGSIIYNLLKVVKMEMRVSEGIDSDFHDTRYGIGRLLSSIEKDGYGEKIPPTHILPRDFLDYHSDLQGSIYHWGYDISLVNSIGMKEHHRLYLMKQIESIQKNLEENGATWSDDVRNTYQKSLEDLKKGYDSL
jgi:hypothetical protein